MRELTILKVNLKVEKFRLFLKDADGAMVDVSESPKQLISHVKKFSPLPSSIVICFRTGIFHVDSRGSYLGDGDRVSTESIRDHCEALPLGHLTVRPYRPLPSTTHFLSVLLSVCLSGLISNLFPACPSVYRSFCRSAFD